MYRMSWVRSPYGSVVDALFIRIDTIYHSFSQRLGVNRLFSYFVTFTVLIEYVKAWLICHY